MKNLTFVGVIFLALLFTVSIAGASNQPQVASDDSTSDDSTSDDSTSDDSTTTASPQLLRLQAATFDPLTGSAPHLDLRTTAHAASIHAAANQNEPTPDNPLGIEPETSYHLVQFVIDPNSHADSMDRAVEPLWLEQLAALGAEPISYVPDNAYLVHVSPPNAEKVLALPFVRWIGPYEPSYKLAPDLAQTLTDGNPPDAVDLYITAFAGESLSKIETFIRELGGEVRSANEAHFGPILVATVPTVALDTILRNPAISWVEPERPLTFTNSVARGVIHADELWSDLGYYGAGQTVAVVDSGLSVQGSLNADFDGRLRQAYTPAEIGPFYENCLSKTTWTDLNGHGTHVAGSIVGNGLNSGSDPSQHSYANSHAGIAPEAELVFIALGLDNTTQIHCLTLDGKFLSNGYDAGARIASNSWGNNNGGRYDILSRLVDEYIWTHPDYLVFFSAGNAGSAPKTLSSPATAKNVLAVGASENARPIWGSYADDPSAVIGFSSRGPTTDGRLKPDIVAPGTWILSTRAEQAPTNSFWSLENQFYAYNGGTSMATPLAAGGATLLREWFARGVGIVDPSAALLKAAIVHNATSFNQPNGNPNSINMVAPDFTSGWGRMNLTDTVSARYLLMEDMKSGIETGDSISFEIEVIGVDRIGTFVAAPPSGYTASLGSSGIFTNTSSVGHRVGSTETISAFFTVEPVEVVNESPPAILAAAQAVPAMAMVRDLIQHSAADAPLDPRVMSHFPVPAALDEQSAAFELHASSGQLAAANTDDALQNLIGGGDFEDPDWGDEWQNVWIRSGDPVRTDQADEVLNGSHSMRVGGGAVGNGIWYPLHFPAVIDASHDLELSLDLRVSGEDTASPQSGYDWFCITLIDSAGAYVEPFSPQKPDCWPNNGDYSFSKKLTNLDELADLSGYLILYMSSNGQAPHMAALIDDVQLTMGFAGPSLTSTPKVGEAGTAFLLAGANFQPSSAVTLCYDSCDTGRENQIAEVNVDGRGVVAFTLQSEVTAAPGLYTVEAVDEVGTSATTTFTIVSAAAPTIRISPTEAVAGSTFTARGEGFPPSEGITEIFANGARIGAAASNADGQIALYVKTTEATDSGSYTIKAVNSAGRSAEARLTVFDAVRLDPQLTVSPASAVAGSQFVFNGSNFDPDVAATLYLGDVSMGTVMVDAVGAFQFTLNSAVDAVSGLHVLRAEQSTFVAETTFEITTPAPTSVPATATPLPATATSVPATSVPATATPVPATATPIPATPTAVPATATPIPATATSAPATPTAIVAEPSERVTALDFTLVWTDPPAPQFAASALINNLDLRVDGPAGTVFGYGGAQSSLAGSQPDIINNVERVRLVDPQPGLYVVTVQGQRVDTIFGPQPFALIGTQEQVPLAESASAAPEPTLEATSMPTSTATPEPTESPLLQTNTPVPDSVDDENRDGEGDDEQNSGEAVLLTPVPIETSPGTGLLPTVVPTAVPASELRVLLPLIEN